jgi:hypothetical protein
MEKWDFEKSLQRKAGLAPKKNENEKNNSSICASGWFFGF